MDFFQKLFAPKEVSADQRSLNKISYEQAQVPDELVMEDFVLRPLALRYAKIDFEALISSIESLQHSLLARHDLSRLTLEENIACIRVHELNHQSRKSFAFSIISPDATECLGCVYIMSLKTNLEQVTTDECILKSVADDEGLVGFWVRQSKLSEGLDVKILESLLPWLEKQWPFSHVSFYVDKRDARQRAIFESAGLKLRFAVEAPADKAHDTATLLIFRSA